VLGRIAQFAQMPEVPERLRNLQTTEELFGLLNDRGV
jgi:mannitol/fructose-specific phosphotransferase system IIA component (Ntr-type)